MNSSVGEKVLKNIKPFWNIFVETSKKQPADVTSSGKFLSESKCDINIKFNKENIFIFGQTHETEKFLKPVADCFHTMLGTCSDSSQQS